MYKYIIVTEYKTNKINVKGQHPESPGTGLAATKQGSLGRKGTQPEASLQGAGTTVQDRGSWAALTETRGCGWEPTTCPVE